MLENSEAVSVVDNLVNNETRDRVDFILDEIGEWAKEDKKIKEELDEYTGRVGLVVNDSFNAFSEHEDFKKIFTNMPKQIIDKVKDKFGEETAAPVIKRMTECFIRVWGNNVTDVYNQIDERIDTAIKSKKDGYSLYNIGLKGENNFVVKFINENLGVYEDNFKLNDVSWGNPAIMRLAARRPNYNIDGLYPLVDPQAKKPRYSIDNSPNRWIPLKKEDDRFDGLRKEISRKTDFFVAIFDNVLDRYFLEGGEKLNDTHWDSIFSNVRLSLNSSDNKKE